MPIRVSCPQCGKEYTVSDDKAGRRFQCKGCQAAITVPSPQATDGNDPFAGMDDFGAPSPKPSGAKKKPSGTSAKGSQGKSSKSKARGTPVGLWIGVGAAVSVAIAVGVFLLMRGGEDDVGDEATNPSLASGTSTTEQESAATAETEENTNEVGEVDQATPSSGDTAVMPMSPMETDSGESGAEAGSTSETLPGVEDPPVSQQTPTQEVDSWAIAEPDSPRFAELSALDYSDGTFTIGEQNRFLIIDPAKPYREWRLRPGESEFDLDSNEFFWEDQDLTASRFLSGVLGRAGLIDSVGFAQPTETPTTAYCLVEDGDGPFIVPIDLTSARPGSERHLIYIGLIQGIAERHDVDIESVRESLDVTDQHLLDVADRMFEWTRSNANDVIGTGRGWQSNDLPTWTAMLDELEESDRNLYLESNAFLRPYYSEILNAAGRGDNATLQIGKEPRLIETVLRLRGLLGTATVELE